MRSKGFAGARKIGYRGNNSRINKILKKGKQYYKVNSNTIQRYKHTIGVHKEDEVVVIEFILANSADEKNYWKFANKPGIKVSLHSPSEERSFNPDTNILKLTKKNKTKRFEIIICK